MQWSRSGVFLGCYGNRELKTLIKLTLFSLMKLLSSGLSHQWRSFTQAPPPPKPRIMLSTGLYVGLQKYTRSLSTGDLSDAVATRVIFSYV
jgi:hypothetical protein